MACLTNAGTVLGGPGSIRDERANAAGRGDQQAMPGIHSEQKTTHAKN